MLLLLIFAVLAGGGTALSPCVLPVLPALLSASATGGRRRPLGIVVGLATTFTITIVGLAEVVDGIGLGSDVLRDLAIVVLLAFGVALVVPALADRLERPLLALSRLGPKTAGSGFATGLLVGGALGFVYAPCAGPILAAVVTVSAASGNTVAIAIAYALGSAAVLLLLSLGGRRLMERVRTAGRGPVVQRALGGVLVLTAACMIAGLDVDLETAIARHAPDVSLTASIENSGAVKKRLRTITGAPKFDSAAASSTTPAAGDAATSAPKGKASGLPKLGRAPEFVGNQDWFNTPGDKPLTMAGLRGKVVLIDFWTYSCINCLRTLPYLKAWNAEYAKDGLVIVGVHSPEFDFEKDAGNVRKAIASNGITYPVVQDNDLKTWNAWGNQYWPADYFVDATGEVRATAFGEGDYDQSESIIRKLLAEAGDSTPSAMAKPTGVVVPSAQATPETYLGAERAQGWIVAPTVGTHQYGVIDTTKALPANAFIYGGQWKIADMSATADGNATIDTQVQAKDVYLVLGKNPGSDGQVRVFTDGRLTKTVDVTDHKLYTLASWASNQKHRLSIQVDRGVTGYAFTFG